jgi:hypothetical protein
MKLEEVEEYKKTLNEELYSDTNPWKAMFDKIDELIKIKISRILIFIGVVFLVCTYLFYGVASDVLCYWIGNIINN